MEGGGCPLETLLNALIIALEIPVLGNSDYLDLALPRLCKAAALLPIHAQVLLQYWTLGPLISFIYGNQLWYEHKTGTGVQNPQE